MATERLTWVDLAKVFSICLVTSYHTSPPLTGYTAQLVQLLRMPAFFLIAGFLFNDKKFPSIIAFLKHRARQLLVPYLCFETILIPLTNHNWNEVQEAIINALLGHPTTCYPLWFLVCLFGMQVIHYLSTQLIQKLTHRDWTHYRYQLLACYALISTLLAPIELSQHFQVNAIVINLPFYAAANCAKDLVQRISWQHTSTAICLIGGLLLLGLKCQWTDLMISCSIHQGLADMGYYLVHLMAGLSLLPPYIALCKAIGGSIGRIQCIEYLGSNTVVILALHTYYILLLSRIIDTEVGEAILYDHPWLNPCLTILIVVGHYPIIWVINKWLPWMLGRGHRTVCR